MLFKNKLTTLFYIIIFTTILVSCQREEKPIVYEEPEVTPIEKAVAVIHPIVGNDVTGVVYFDQTPAGIKIIADIDGLEAGKHGFHIHQYGDAREEDATSAGGHFNPENQSHSAPSAQKRHVGDLGNIVAVDNETAHYEIVDTLISLTGKHSIIGRSVIIHSGEDDFTTQPTGNAGARVGMGIIGIANPELQ